MLSYLFRITLLLLTGLLGGFPMMMQAQPSIQREVLACEGESVGSGSIQLSYTLGEPFIESSPILTEGFQQPFIAPQQDSVWPGDANLDGIANVWDLLPIGLAYGELGPTRTNASINWQAQFAPNWTGFLANQVNYKHVDTNGDGLVFDDDTLAIIQNYGFTHNKTGHYNCEDGIPLYLHILNREIKAGDTVVVLVKLGVDTLIAKDVYGIALSIELDTSLIDTIYVSSQNSWMGTLGVDLIDLAYYSETEQRLDLAMVRTDHLNMTDYGMITAISIIMVDDLSSVIGGQDIFPLGISDRLAISNDESIVPLCSWTDSIFVINNVNVDDNAWNHGIRIFPNPTQNLVQIELDHIEGKAISIHDVFGREVLYKRESSHIYALSLKHLPAGMYNLRLYTSKGVYNQLIQVDH